MSETQVTKPGVTTTEFWVAALSPILMPILMSLVNKYGLPLTPEAIMGVITITVATPLVYIFGRILNKVKAANIVVAKTTSEPTIVIEEKINGNN